jgi:hypothetical protein
LRLRGAGRQRLDRGPGRLGDAGLVRAIERIEAIAAGFDDVLVDLPSGLERIATLFVERASRLVIVGNNEPTTLTDNYAFIKLTRAVAPPPCFLANGVADRAEGGQAHATLARACRRFLDLDCRSLGAVRKDARVPEAIRRQILSRPLAHRRGGSRHRGGGPPPRAAGTGGRPMIPPLSGVPAAGMEDPAARAVPGSPTYRPATGPRPRRRPRPGR